jgi:hypothetical protein
MDKNQDQGPGINILDPQHSSKGSEKFSLTVKTAVFMLKAAEPLNFDSHIIKHRYIQNDTVWSLQVTKFTHKKMSG